VKARNHDSGAIPDLQLQLSPSTTVFSSGSKVELVFPIRLIGSGHSNFELRAELFEQKERAKRRDSILRSPFSTSEEDWDAESLIAPLGLEDRADTSAE
jgi:hypothetical protein